MKLDNLITIFLNNFFINDAEEIKVNIGRQSEEIENGTYDRKTRISKTVILTKEDMENFIKKLCRENVEKSTFRIVTKEAEMLINAENIRYYQFHRNQTIFKVNNPAEKITYNVANISVEYFMNLLLNDSITEPSFIYIVRSAFFRIRSRRDGSIFVDEEENVLNTSGNNLKYHVIHKIFENYFVRKYLVLKLKFKNEMSLDKCKQHFLSYIFNLNLKGIKIRPSENAEDFFNIRNLNVKSYNKLSAELKAPYKAYSEDLIHLYSNAAWSDNPFTKYIMFYQILERYFTKIPEERMVDFVKDKFTNPKISFKDNKQVLDLCIAIGEKQKNNKKEQQQLLEVLKHFLSDFNSIISDLTPDQIHYYQNEVPSFIKSPDHNITFDLTTNNIKDTVVPIAYRIYIVRNALVHNKGNRDNNYDPTRDYSSLMKEVPLIKSIAEEIMIMDAKQL